MNTARRIFLLTVLCALCGCGGNDGLKLGEVTGTVKDKKGKAVVGATVTFAPQTKEKEAPTSSGTTDDEGRFELKIIDGRSGALVGKHIVRIRLTEGKEDDDSGESIKERIPKKYNDESTDERTVNEGDNSFDFTVELLPK